MLVYNERSDKFDNSTLSVYRSREQFRTLVASLYQVQRRTTPNELVRKAQQTRRIEGSRSVTRNREEVRSEEQEFSRRSSSRRDRAQDAEQFDDILRTFMNAINKFENRLGKIRGEEKMFVVQKLMLESLLNSRFRGTTQNYEELFIALENIIRKTLTQVLQRKSGWPPRMTVKSSREEWAGQCKPFTKEQAKATGGPDRLQAGTHRGTRVAKVARMRIVEERIHAERQRQERRQRNSKKGGNGDHRTCWTCGTAGKIAASCSKKRKREFVFRL